MQENQTVEVISPDVIFPPPVTDAVTRVDKNGRPLPGLVKEPDWADKPQLEALIQSLIQIGDLPALAAKYAPVMQMTARGMLWKHIQAETGITWQEYRNFKMKTPELRELSILADMAGEDFRKEERRDASHERAVHGVKRGVWQRDADGNPVKVETLTEYSDRLLERERVADEPQRFVERSEVNSTQKNLTFIVNLGGDELKAESAKSAQASTSKQQPDKS